MSNMKKKEATKNCIKQNKIRDFRLSDTPYFLKSQLIIQTTKKKKK